MRQTGQQRDEGRRWAGKLARWLAWALPVLPAVLWVAAVTYGQQDAPAEPNKADALAGQSVVLTLDSGKQLEGTLLSRGEEQVVLRIAGVRTRIDAAGVSSIRKLKSVAERYRQRRAELSDDDVRGRRRLVRWLLEKRAYELAMGEIRVLRRRFPDNREIQLLERVAEQQMKLARAREKRDQQDKTDNTDKSDNTDKADNTDNADNEADDADEAQGPANQQGQGEREDQANNPAQQPDADQPDTDQPDPMRDRLTQQQVNVIRVWEIDPTTKPRVRVPEATIERLFERYGDHEDMPEGENIRQRIRRADGWQQLQLMFRVKARDLYEEVQVLADPEPLKTFRQSLHQRYVLSGCGAAGCHGDKPRGGLYLFRRAAETDRTVYTNFYILSQYTSDQGRMLDRQAPARSLLLQYGLPRDTAETPHPPVERWRPLLRNTQNERYQAFIDMIGGLYEEPAYGLDYTPPGQPTGDQESPQAPSSAGEKSPPKR